mgnify:CR=1 FL=1
MDLELTHFTRIPKHIGVIPDGNRRWALEHGFSKELGYEYGINPGFQLYELCRELGVEELTLYGFTQDNTKRPSVQTKAFQKACVDAVRILANRDASLLVIGDSDSPMFPEELKPYRTRSRFGPGSLKVNFLVNYGWLWDLDYGRRQLVAEASDEGAGDGESMRSGESVRSGKSGASGTERASGGKLLENIASADISRVDLIIRWGGRRRLSGFLPVQSIYADFYVVDEYWPDFAPSHLYEALEWYQSQDVTLGG